ncbi:MAG TPA: glycosyl hydrolase family 28-related protein [Stellaceae bacterium]|nr:glycosyl hydrolase family 28-related protein [Terriglobia bacterium]HEV2551783.1 glycosyl hydrolase family 28-related protein [Stellaceae bacterium]
MSVPATLSSVPAVTPYIQYVATTGQTVFPYPFPITQDADLIVVINGVTQATDSGYTLTGQGSPTGGNLTFTLGRTSGDIVTLFRNIAIARLTQIAQNSGFSSTAFNAEFNNIYLLLQQLNESIGFCLQVPNTNSPTPSTTLVPANYANKYLAFDANGNPTPALLTSVGSLTQAIIAGLFQPQTQAEISAGVVPTSFVYPPLYSKRYGAVGDGVTDDTAALNNMLTVAKQKGGTCTLANGNYLVTAPLNLANIGAFQVILQGESQGQGIYNTTPTSGANLYGKTGTQAVIETQGSHRVTLRDFNIYSLAADASRSSVGIFQSRTTVQNSCQYHNYQRVGIFLASNSAANAGLGAVGLYNLGAEHGLYDLLVINGDTSLLMEDNNAYSYTPTYGTLSSIPSCSQNSFRQCAFVPVNGNVNNATRLSGVNTVSFIDCYWGNVAGSIGTVLDAFLITSTGALNEASDIFILGGSVENWNSFLQIGDNVTNLKIDLAFASPLSPGPIMHMNVNNNQVLRGADINFRNHGSGAIQLLGVGSATGDQIYGGRFVLDSGMSWSASTLSVTGSVINDMNTSPATVSLKSGSTYLLTNTNGVALSIGTSISTKLKGTATFVAATTIAVSLGVTLPTATYQVSLGGNAAGFVWVTGKSTTGFTINCSAANSNSTDWTLEQ